MTSSDAAREEQAIRDLVARWQQATLAGDLPAVLELMAEDVVFLVAGQPPMRGRAAFAAAFAQLSPTFRIDSSSRIEEVQTAGNLAYCLTHLDVRLTPADGGAPQQRSGYTLTVLRREPAGNWVLWRDANLLQPAPARA